jgi:hypothetical protein
LKPCFFAAVLIPQFCEPDNFKAGQGCLCSQKNGGIQMIELLKNLVAAVSFRPEEGPFRNALVAKILADADEERAELFSSGNYDIKVTISQHTQQEGFVRFVVISDLGEQSLECDLAGLNALESADLREQVLLQTPEHRPGVSGGSTKVIVRKASSAGMYTQQQSADKLGCSGEFIKNKVPCSDYSYDEIDGKKVLREYYWSQALIDRLLQVKQTGVKPDDIKYVAAECCYGDCTWAEELLALLRPKASVNMSGNTKKNTSRFTPKSGANPHPERRK